jgi:PAS domain S-box-containing protein
MRYADVVQYLREEAMTLEINNRLTQQIENKIFPYKAHPILEKCVLRKKIFVANERIINTLGLEVADLVNLLGVKEFAVLPLVGREGVFGVVIVDNYYTKKPIKESDVDILKILSDSAGLAIETAQSYEELRNKTLSLERQKSLIEYLREFSESILQNMSSAIIVIDKEGKVTEWNKKAEVYFNRPKEQMTGVELRALGPEFEDIEEMAFQAMRIKEEITLSNYLIQTGGRERYYDVKITPFWDADKLMLRGVIITLDDVTERVNLEKERKKQEKLAALGEMAARVAHELRNPISVLGGFIKRLEKNADNPDARNRYIKIIADEILRLEQIVNEILDFSREPRSLEFTYFNINKLVNDVYILLEEKIREKNILFTFETDAEEITVYAEYSRMKQVIINLLQNAIEATPKDGKILIETRIKLDKIVVSIWNEGTPIDKETAEKLFTPFFTTKVHGTGLGLAICKKIIEDEHKGKIYHEATEDGNRFVVELPKTEVQSTNVE